MKTIFKTFELKDKKYIIKWESNSHIIWLPIIEDWKILLWVFSYIFVQGVDYNIIKYNNHTEIIFTENESEICAINYLKKI